MVSTPLKPSALADKKKLNPLQQRLLKGLKLLPQDISLCLLNGNKVPQGIEWEKNPYTIEQVRQAIIDGVELINSKGETYRFYPKGYGIITGLPIQVNGETFYPMAMDCDGYSAIAKMLELSRGQPLPLTVAFTSGRDGRCQYLFLVPEQYAPHIQTKKFKTQEKTKDSSGEQLELRWRGLQSCLPPSVHPMTRVYRYVEGQTFGETEMALAPDWVIEQMLSDGGETEPNLPMHDGIPVNQVRYDGNIRHPDEIQVPVPGAIPLELCCTKEVRALIKSGVEKGNGRNDAAIKIGLELVGVSRHLQNIGQPFSNGARQLFTDFCRRSGMTAKEEDERFKWCEAKTDTSPSCPQSAIEASIRGWYWREHVLPTGRGYGSGSGNGSGNGGGNRRGFNGGSGSGGDGGDGDTPSKAPISPEDLAARLDKLVQQGLTGSKLTGALNLLAEKTGRHIQELRKQYLERIVEVERDELREDTAQQVEQLLEASTASIDLQKILPSSLATPLLKLAGWLNLKPESYLTALLTTASVLHKVGTTVLLNQEWDFEVSPNLYSAIIAPSSQKKSPILKAICKKPLTVLQKNAHEEYKRQMEAYEKELKDWETDESEDRGPAPEKPQRKVYFFTKTTGEGITYQAARCPMQGMLYLSDELAGMLGAQNQYRGGLGSDKQDLLSSYDGMGETVLRADGIRSETDYVLLGIIGGIQPKIMQKLLDDCSDSDGGWARFLFVNQPNAASEMKADGGSYDLTNLLAGLYRQIDALSPTTYRLSPEAFRLFCQAYNGLEKKRVSDRLEGMQAVWGKSEGRIGKLAVNLHVIDSLINGQTPSEEIPVEFIQAAITLTKYYAQQVQSLYTQFSDPDALAPHLANVIQLAQRQGDWIKASDVYLSITKKHRPSGETVREWFNELVVMGKGQVKGEGRTLQFRVFSDKHPPTPPPSAPAPSDAPQSEKLDDFRQALDKSSNAESTTYQGSQEKLDKLDKLDDFPKNELTPVEVEEEELDVNELSNQGGVSSSVEKNQVFSELSNLSNNSQDDQLVDDTALDDLSKESSNLDNLDKDPEIRWEAAPQKKLPIQFLDRDNQPIAVGDTVDQVANLASKKKGIVRKLVEAVYEGNRYAAALVQWNAGKKAEESPCNQLLKNQEAAWKRKYQPVEALTKDGWRGGLWLEKTFVNFEGEKRRWTLTDDAQDMIVFDGLIRVERRNG